MNGTQVTDPLPPDVTGDDVSIPLGTGELGDVAIDPLGAATSSRKMGGGIFVIVIVVVAAVAGLYSMRLISHLNAAHDVDTKAEQIIDDFITSGQAPQKGPALTEVIDGITSDRMTGHVNSDEVQRDPFTILSRRNDDTPEPPPPPKSATPEEIDRALRNAIGESGKRFRLTSTIVGSRPIAIIDGETVQIGDILKIHNAQYQFVVTHIAEGSVELEVTDEKLIHGPEVVALIMTTKGE